MFINILMLIMALNGGLFLGTIIYTYYATHKE